MSRIRFWIHLEIPDYQNNPTILYNYFMIILSIDPGFDKMGIAVFEKAANFKPQNRLIDSCLIKTKRNNDHEQRLLVIHNELTRLVAVHKADLIVMEELFYSNNQKSVIKVGQSQGIVYLVAAQARIPVMLLTPLEIKSIITGYGNADKKSVHKMLKLLLKQDVIVKDDDESDAIACGLAYCYINQDLV